MKRTLVAQIELKPDIFTMGLMQKKKKNTAIMNKKITFIRVAWDFTEVV